MKLESEVSQNILQIKINGELLAYQEKEKKCYCNAEKPKSAESGEFTGPNIDNTVSLKLKVVIAEKNKSK